jgi:acetolactate synthase-1/3 small subunit
MRHIIGILLQNEAGALSRAAAMFASRGFNIESLSVAPTTDPAVSRLTLVTTGADQVVLQIVNQLNKLVDVVSVDDMTLGEHLERELVLVQLQPGATGIEGLRALLQECGGRLLESSPRGCIAELAGSEAEISRLIARLTDSATLLEVVRSGALAVSLGGAPSG